MFLLDNNLSWKIARRIEHIFSGCIHVESVGLDDSDDPVVWDFACQNNLHILTKDADFSRILTFRGFPPKVVWLKCGNVSTREIVERVLDNEVIIHDFLTHPPQGCSKSTEPRQRQMWRRRGRCWPTNERNKKAIPTCVGMAFQFSGSSGRFSTASSVKGSPAFFTLSIIASFEMLSTSDLS